MLVTRKSNALAALAVLFMLPLFFNACGSPTGFGKPIDWEPPVLTLDEIYPNPMYVRQGAILTGDVADNVGVSRIILREAGKTEEMFRAELLPGNRWKINLDFTPEQNNQKLMVEIVAYDAVGNSGESSIVAITLIVDIRPPVIEDMSISRTAVRTAYLESYHELKDLERTDPHGYLSANVNRYQNGYFYINGKAAEEETRIEIIKLNIYDATRDPNEPLVSLDRLDGSSAYTPRWLVKEEDILDAGDAKWPGYKNNYYGRDEYDNSPRYYYRVVIHAIDRSDNESEQLIMEDEGFFCMWEGADEPRGVLDPLVGNVVTKGATLPVEFFEDDTLDWAYAALLTKAQWNGEENIAPGDVKIPDGENKVKLDWLKERLTAPSNNLVYDWKYQKYPSGAQQAVVDQIGGKTRDELIVMLQTGNNDDDSGAYVLFTLTADKKIDPHTGSGPRDTNKGRWKGRVWDVSVVDENEPLIVFDTVDTSDPGYPTDKVNHAGSDVNEPIQWARTGDSPEENTFPRLPNGKTFVLNGYTLRANKTGQEFPNSVVKFRMAWIPHGIGADNYVKAVQNALSDPNYPALFNTMSALGIQHWDFDPVKPPYAAAPASPTPGNGVLIEGTAEIVGDNEYKKQVFKKEFNILGGQDDLKSSYNNFTYDGNRENETKLFVLYAEDNVGHIVYRQMRLLGNKTPPDLAVYDITAKDGIILPTAPPELPNLNNSDSNYGAIYFNGDGTIDDDGREKYKEDLLAYQPFGYDAMKPVALDDNGKLALTDNDKTEPYQAYPRDTEIKYWVMAEKSGDLAVENITMRDITFATDTRDVGHYDPDDRAFSYIEMLPEVTQRVFLFVATDSLGNQARIQRTVAVTNAAVLNSITTSKQNGSYGIGQTITLQANFSNLVRWEGTNPPLLNVRHYTGGTSNSPGSMVVRQIATKTPSNSAVLFLEFDLVIEEGYTGTLQTMYFGMDSPAGDDNYRNNRPITLPSGTRILDNSRGDDAFTPRNVPGFDWTAAGQGPRSSLGSSYATSKKITLQGIRPEITGLSLTNVPAGKTSYAEGYYFKADETIEFTLTANNSIFTSGDPTIGLNIGGTWRTAAWQKSSGANGMVFSVLVNSANTPTDGTVSAIRLNDVSTIVDSVGNAFLGGSDPLPIITYPNPSYPVPVLHIDKERPAAPGTTLNGNTAGGSTTNYYSANPTLAIPANTSGESAPVAKTQYSLNNGVTWRDWPNVEAALNWTSAGDTAGTLKILNGQWTLVTRYIDRAGNEGLTTSQPIHVNAKFPELKSITAVQPNGNYRAGSLLEFDLAFDDAVWTQNTATVTITLSNRNDTNTHKAGGTGLSYQQQLTATNVTQANPNSTIRFAWNNITGKEMLDGLYVSAVNFGGLRDRFGNVGGSGTAGITGTTPGTLSISGQTPVVTNLNGAGIKVDCLGPVVTSMSPVNADGKTGNVTTSVSSDNKTITLTFDEPVQRGRGTITVRPHGSYAIPAVLENDGYYLTVNLTTGEENRSSTAGINSTYVSGMYDIYNNMPSNPTTDRNYLIGGDNTNTMASPAISRQTGLSVGPYKKMTHGLTAGAGYTGNYSDTNPQAPAAPSPADGYMIPDTATKWVLDYQYLIHDTTGTVNNIRNALTRVGFRRQDIAVTSTANVVISATENGAESTTGRYVKITLSEPLLPGLQWGLFYPAGTFTDTAGNSALALGPDLSNNANILNDSTFWFWSSGVQRPVIRVDRKSYDARSGNPNLNGGNATYNANGNAGTIDEFNTIKYRIETETPRAGIFYNTREGSGWTGGSVTGDWTGDVVTGTSWNGTTDTNTTGRWVLTNLIFRNTDGNFSVQENGISISHTINNYYGFRSFNRDATESELNVLGMSNDGGTQAYEGSFSYDDLEASKSYVVAEARVGHSNVTTNTVYNTPMTYTSQKGWEGVFRTIIAINRDGDSNYIALMGTNVKNGIPTVAGFPAKDGAHDTDQRYMKLFYNSTGRRHYWVSTEIVTNWYMQSVRNEGGNYQRTGDSVNWLTAGYGDLSYAYHKGNDYWR